MRASISVFQPREVARAVSALQSACERLWARSIGALESLALRLSGLASYGKQVGKSEVELVFWIHKALLVGFILALASMALKG